MVSLVSSGAVVGGGFIELPRPANAEYDAAKHGNRYHGTAIGHQFRPIDGGVFMDIRAGKPICRHAGRQAEQEMVNRAQFIHLVWSNLRHEPCLKLSGTVLVARCYGFQ